jgi:hypothetical protein
MTTDLSWLTTDPLRCPRCYLHRAQGHRSLMDGRETGCRDSGPLGSLLGEQRKAEAFARLDASDSTDETATLRRAIIALGHRKHEFTASDLPAHIRESTNPNRRGRVFSELLDKGVIVAVGTAKSENARAHGKAVNVYRLRVAA